MIQVPGLLEHVDRLEATPALRSSVVIKAALRECRKLRTRLLHWHEGLQSTQCTPLFRSEVMTTVGQRNECSTASSSDLDDILREVLIFESSDLAQMLFLYWFGEIALAELTITLYRLFDCLLSTSVVEASIDCIASPNELKRSIEAMDSRGRFFASQICKAVSGYRLYPPKAFVLQFTLVPLWSAQQFFHKRSESVAQWCQVMLQVFKERGFTIAEPLRRMEVWQYPGMDGRGSEARETSVGL